MKSEILIVGHPRPSEIEMGADFISEIEFAAHNHLPSVVVAPARLFRKQNSCRAHVILVLEDEHAADLFVIVGKYKPYRIAEGWSDPQLENHIVSALAEHRQVQQQTRLLQTLREQNAHLVKLSADIERQVEFRLNELESQRRELTKTQSRLQVIHQALISAFRADSIPELETKITLSLTPEFGVEWTKIRYLSQTGSESIRLSAPYLQLPLMRDDMVTGTVTFGRTQKNFEREERRLLDQVAQTLNLILRRLERWMELERSRIGWEATFDSIREPLSIIDQDRNIIRVNQEFAASAQMPIDQI